MIGELISAGSKLIGGIVGQKAQDRQMAKNRALQKEFAQRGIQWKVADAKAAGLHPLAALGAQTSSPAVQVGGSPLGDSLASMGQDISRAVAQGTPVAKRNQQFVEATQALQLERGSLENQLLKAQINKLNMPGTGPGLRTGPLEAGTVTRDMAKGDQKKGLWETRQVQGKNVLFPIDPVGFDEVLAQILLSAQAVPQMWWDAMKRHHKVKKVPRRSGDWLPTIEWR